ncbi:MAG: alpha-glucosidase/alpha-galactosidase [Thermoanaerobacteraceae bacterium]
MIFEKDAVKDINIAYIGGGSRGWAWTFMSDLALESQLSGTIKLYDIDFESAYSNEIIGNNISKMKEAKSIWKYKAVKSLEEALNGADFVIISILPGTFEEMVSDIYTPEKYGIYQSVGDTVGPGGIVRALRAVPMFIEFAESIKKYAPKAWVINYTNPMTVCTRTLYEVFPEIKALGACHEVLGGKRLLADMLIDSGEIEINKEKREEEIQKIIEEIQTNVLGINHFTWFSKATYKHHNLIKLFGEFAEKYYKTGFDKYEGKKGWKENYFTCGHRVKFDLYKRYGLVPTTNDRHLVEFMGSIYLKDYDTIKRWMFHLTPVSYRIKKQEELYEMSKQFIKGNKKMPLEKSHEEGVKIIKGILGLKEVITNINIPNVGQMQGIPIGAVVETNAIFTKDSVIPVVADVMPYDLQSIVLRHVYNQELTLKAAIKKDKNYAFRAFINDPLVSIEIEKAEELFSIMLKNTKEYLPGWEI